MTADKLNIPHCLGIESTADDFGVGVATFNGDILANVSNGYIPKQAAYTHGKQQGTTQKSPTKSYPKPSPKQK
jgi:hypothetical protein